MRIRLMLGTAALLASLTGCAAAGAPAAVVSGAATATSVATVATDVPSPTPPATSSTPASQGAPAFTAYGSTTPWRAVVDGGVMTTEGAGVGEHRVPVTGSAWSRGAEFTGTDEGRSYSLVIRAGHCEDVDGTDTGQVAELNVGNRKLRGCALSGAVPHADDA